jgi:hypothetical protein
MAEKSLKNYPIATSKIVKLAIFENFADFTIPLFLLYIFLPPVLFGTQNN